MQNNHALVLGASGLIGSQLVEQLINDPNFSKITLLLRKELHIKSEKIEQKIVDFQRPNSWKVYFENVDVVFCAVGTTRSKTPDLDAYRKIDFDIPVVALFFAEENRVDRFMLVSSIGADSKSKNFYLKIKGEVEDELNQRKIKIRGVFQPSLLLGKRQEKRFGEGLARVIMPLFNFLIPFKYKAVEAKVVARAMVQASKSQIEKFKVYQYKEMTEL